jgi:ADP-ribosylglycohydrolase
MKRPLTNSYWVEPGRLLAGEHPDGGGETATRERLATLVAAGINGFIDLTEQGELRPYRSLLPADVTYENFPMPDHGVPHPAQLMREVQVALERRMAAGATLYVHCRAGIGRTGIAIGCYLREQGESPQGALAELNRLWKQNARASQWPTVPETDAQVQFIRDWQPHPLDAASEAGESGLHRLTLRPLQRYRGALVGLALGDALANEGGGWTDDTAMTVCVAESLLARQRFDGRDQLERYRIWAQDPVAAGAAAGAALRPGVRAVLSRAAWNRSVLQGTHDPSQLDPSPLARCAAAALFTPGKVGVASALGGDVARVTHQAPVLVDACRLFTGMISLALAGHARRTVLQADRQLGGMPLRDEIRMLSADWCAPSVGRRRPWQSVLGTLDRAVRCFARSRGFDDGMARALDSHREDRDAVCASYGALAGAYYGEASISAALRARVTGLARIERLADELYRYGSALHGSVA